MGGEGEIVVERFGWWLRAYAGHTGSSARARLWQSDLSRGAYLRLRGERVLGLQWRRSGSRR